MDKNKVDYLKASHDSLMQIFNPAPVKPQNKFASSNGNRSVRPPQNMPAMPAGAGRVPQVKAPTVETPEVPMEEQLPFAMKGKNNGE